jgi:hypothetical protein
MPKFEPESDGATETANRRRDPRIPIETPVELCLDAEVLRGVAQDLSAQGICFFTESELKVRVRLGEHGEVELPGRLVRLESVTDGQLVVAVRFDQRIDPKKLSS